jgi:NodT family efflux transporter outer membrane factor (OMF) lipoprotein
MKSFCALLPLLLLAACTVGPDYKKPPAAQADRFKELAGWKPASPMDTIDRGAWWSVYRDPLLDRLMADLNINNETIKQNYYAYQEALALVDEARAAYFPTAGLNAGVTRAAFGSGAGSSRLASTGTTTSGTTTTATGTSAAGTTIGSSTVSSGLAGAGVSGGGGGTPTTTWSLQGSASWSPDVWGRVRRQVESNVAGAQLSAATLANVRLSEQALLATDYFLLRTEDALQKLLNDTVRDYRRSLEITQNQYAVGVAARSDVITAQVQLQTTLSQAINVGVARAQYEHAIAVLTGHPPADLTIAAGPLATQVPVAPVVVPSVLLERRPDIAEAERTMQEQNALIGVDIAAFYPDISLSALFGYSGNPLGSLISASNQVWSLGANATETLFDAGLRASTVRAQRALYDESVASYRLTVLTAFQQAEDDLAGLRILEQQEAAQQDAVKLARRAVEISLNEYRAGTVAFTTVVTAQATALADEETLLSIQQTRLTTSVALIEALGGGWTTADLPGRPDLTRRKIWDPREQF